MRLGSLRPLLRFARHDLRGWLEAGRLSKEVVDDVALACSEACANAIEHPKQPRRHLVEIEGRLDDTRLELRVRDFGSWAERRSSGQRGRGLSMIGELMDSLDVERHLDGTEIVMRRSVAGGTQLSQIRAQTLESGYGQEKGGHPPSAVVGAKARRR